MKLPPFQQLLDAHGRDVHRFLVATVGRSDADDCYQETWLAALRAYPRLRDASNLRELDPDRRPPQGDRSLRARGAHGRCPSRRFPSRPAPGRGRPADDELWALVRELPNKQRTAVALRYVADAPYAEISAVMGTSEEAARRNVHEGLKRLRMEYQR